MARYDVVMGGFMFERLIQRLGRARPSSDSRDKLDQEHASSGAVDPLIAVTALSVSAEVKPLTIAPNLHFDLGCNADDNSSGDHHDD